MIYWHVQTLESVERVQIILKEIWTIFIAFFLWCCRQNILLLQLFTIIIACVTPFSANSENILQRLMNTMNWAIQSYICKLSKPVLRQWFGLGFTTKNPWEMKLLATDLVILFKSNLSTITDAQTAYNFQI